MLVLGEKTRSDEPVTLFIARGATGYVTWGPEADEDFREALNIAPGKDLPTISIRPWGNRERSEYVRDQLKRFKRVRSELPAAVEERIGREANAHHILVGWSKIGTTKGAETPYTPEAGTEAFRLDPDFHEAVIAAAMDERNFRDAVVAEDAEALGNDSAGSSSGGRTSKGSKTRG
jgi:hypothetical protein